MHADDEEIYIIGAGAIGRVLAVFLRLAGRKATLIRGTVNDGSKTVENIRVEMPDGQVHEAEVTVATLNAFPSINGIVVIASKSFGNDRLAALLKERAGRSPIVLLQNGLGVERPFVERGFPDIYRCVLFVTSQSIDAVVRFRPVAVCPVGIERGDPNRLNEIVDQLSTPRFAFRAEPNIQHVVWKKAIVNCAFNSICPLLGVDNGIFYRNEVALELARQVIAECTLLARENGIPLDRIEVEESLLQISRSSDGQLISTLQDINQHRRTEIDTLNLEIGRIAESLQMSTAVQATVLLGQLTLLKAEISMQQAASIP